MDRAVGGLSGLPIILYILSLYLFARRHFISIIPARLQWSVKVLLTLLIPVILILAELGSLLGFSYSESCSGAFGGFSLTLRSHTPWHVSRVSRALQHSAFENPMDAAKLCWPCSSYTIPICLLLSRNLPRVPVLYPRHQTAEPRNDKDRLERFKDQPTEHAHARHRLDCRRDQTRSH